MFKLSNNMYNTLKWIVMIFMPALAALYLGLADYWNLPYPEQVTTTIAALTAFLGIFIQISNAVYKVDLADKTITQRKIKVVSAKVLMSNQIYDILKWFTTIFLPAASTLYLLLAETWSLPYAEEVAGTVALLITFLGALIQISSARYKASLLLTTNAEFLENPNTQFSMFSFDNTTYDRLKFISQAVLPALATLYAALAGVWGLPFGEQISASLIGVALFLNALLQISSAKYKQAVDFNKMTEDLVQQERDRHPRSR